MTRLAPALPLVLAAILFGAVAEAPLLAAALAALALAPSLFRARLDLPYLAELVASGALVGAATAIASLAPARAGAFGGVLGPLAVPGALACLLLAAGRRFLASPRFGEGGTQALALGAVVACAAGRPASVVVAGTAAVLLASALAMRALDPARPAPARLSTSRRVVSLLGLGLTAASTAGLGALLPWAYDRAGLVLTFDGAGGTVGFDGNAIRLGSRDGIYESPELVLRVFGHEGDPLLRGATFVDYRGGAWFAGERRLGAVEDAALAGEGVVRLEQVQEGFLPAFAPLEVEAVAVPGGVRRDARGIVEPARPGTGVAAYRPGPRSTPLAPPGDAERSVPDALAPELARLAASFAGGAVGPEARLDALVSALETRYAYSLRSARPGRRDPVLEFLLDEPRGHCELFASALALLARADGTPTRVVTGYRVSEVSPLGGYHLVRERNAHAWVEAWLPGKGWVTRDPSPVEALAAVQPSRASLPAALLDQLRVLAGGARGFLARRTPGELAAAAGALVAALVAFAIVRRLRRRAPGARRDPFVPAPPLAMLPVLEEALARGGLRRTASEPLERFAARIREGAPEAAALLARYAELRYGGVGEATELDAAVRAFVDRSRRGGDR